MNTTLDPFESALLAELRRHVAEHPVPQPRRPRHRLRLAAVAATGVAASVVAVLGLGGTGGSPAYAVDTTSDGDVVVTVHRLDDEAGLEDALSAQGIDADVDYDADGFSGSIGVGPDGEPLSHDDQLRGLVPPSGAPAEGGSRLHVEGQGEARAGGADGPTLEAGPGGPPAGDDPCGLGGDPATLTRAGADWVLTIPAGSPLQDRHVYIGTDSGGALSVSYAGDKEGSYCGMVSVTRGTPPQ